MAINPIIGSGGTLFRTGGAETSTPSSRTCRRSSRPARKSTTYSGFGVGEGFAVAARSQLSSIFRVCRYHHQRQHHYQHRQYRAAVALEVKRQVQNDAASTPQNLNSNGQTIAQQNAVSVLNSIVGILNTQAGDRSYFPAARLTRPRSRQSDNILTAMPRRQV